MSTDTLGSVLEPILTAAMTLTQFEKGNIQVLDEDSGFLTIESQHGFDATFLETFKIVKATDGCACGRAIRLRQPVFIDDVMSDGEYGPFRQAASSAGYRSVLSLPLITAQGRLVGVMSVHHSAPYMSPEGLAYLNDLAEFAAGAISRHRYADRSPSIKPWRQADMLGKPQGRRG